MTSPDYPEDWMRQPKPPEPCYRLLGSARGGQGILFKDHHGRDFFNSIGYPGTPVDALDHDSIDWPRKARTAGKTIAGSISGSIDVASDALREDILALDPTAFHFFPIELETGEGGETARVWQMAPATFLKTDALHKRSFSIDIRKFPVVRGEQIIKEGSAFEWSTTIWGGIYCNYQMTRGLHAWHIGTESQFGHFYASPEMLAVIKKHNPRIRIRKEGWWGKGDIGWHPVANNVWPPQPLPLPRDAPEQVGLKDEIIYKSLWRNHPINPEARNNHKLYLEWLEEQKALGRN